MHNPWHRAPVMFGLAVSITGAAGATCTAMAIGHARMGAERMLREDGNTVRAVTTGAMAAGDKVFYCSISASSILYASASDNEAGASSLSTVISIRFALTAGNVRMRLLPMVVPPIVLMALLFSS